MGLTRKKPELQAEAERTTEQRLADARSELAQIEAAIIESGRDRDLALLDDDADGVRRAEATTADLDKDKERAARRVMLLEERAAAEMKARQEKAQSDLIDRSAADFRERDAATVEMCQHLQSAVEAFRRATAAGISAVSGWPFGFGDNQAAMIGKAFIHAIPGELYRLGGDDTGRSPEFPGARCPDIRDSRPQSVKPLADKATEATAYALRIMRESPIRALPVAAPPQPLAAAIAPVGTPESGTSAQSEPPAPAEGPRVSEYAYVIDMLELATGKRTTQRIVFRPEQVAETYLDGIGPLGPRGREMALRLAAAGAPEGHQIQPGTLRFDMAALERSIEGNEGPLT